MCKVTKHVTCIPICFWQLKLQEIVDEFESIKSEIPPVVQLCMRPLVGRVEDTILPGLTMITWASMNFDKFLNDVTDAVEELKVFTKKV